MDTETESVHRTGSRGLWLPFLMIAISVIMALIELTYVLGSYFHLYQPSNSLIELMLFSADNALVVPLFVTGVALLLMLLTRAKKGVATWSRLTFFGGAVLLIVGGLFSIAVFWVEYSSRNLMDADFNLLNQLSIIGGVVATLGAMLCALATALLARSYLKGEISGNLGSKQQTFESNQRSWIDTHKNPVIALLAVLVVLVIFLASISIVAYFPFSEKQIALPVHNGDYIVWSVNGTRSGQNVSGVSFWTFNNVSSAPFDIFLGHVYAYKYDIAIRTELNGITVYYQTAGAFDDPKLWSLGINPAVLLEEHDGYYNGGSQIFDHNESLSTTNGLKATAVYIELYNNNSTDMWSKMWIDVSNGTPYRIQMTEPDALNGFANIFSGTLTFQMLATDILQ